MSLLAFDAGSSFRTRSRSMRARRGLFVSCPLRLAARSPLACLLAIVAQFIRDPARARCRLVVPFLLELEEQRSDRIFVDLAASGIDFGPRNPS
jgi:hypothetical protein